MTGSTVDIAFRYTDQEYVSRSELVSQLGSHFYEPMWKTILDYRKKYEVPLDVVQYNRLPFRLVLTPSILAEINSVELLLLAYMRRYNQLGEAEKYSTEKVLSSYHHDILREELRMISSLNDVPFIEREVETFLNDPQGVKGNHHLVKGYFQALSHLIQHPEKTIEKQSFRDLWNVFTATNALESATFYRTVEPKTLETSVFGNQYDGAPIARIPEMMNSMFSFYSEDYELSPFIVAGIIYTYLLYVNPLPSNNLEAANIIMQQVLCYSGYGPGIYYTSPLQYLVQRKEQMDKLLEEVRKTGDMTYLVMYIIKRWKDAIIWRQKQLNKLPVPLPFRGEVQVVEKLIEVPIQNDIEKIVEVPVDRIVEKIVEVPVERIVEKIVEVPVDRIVEKIVEVPVDRIVEKIVEVPVDRIVERIVEVPVDRIVEKIVEVPVERIIERLLPSATERIVEVPVEKIVEKIVEVPVDRIVERLIPSATERIVEVPVEKIVEKIIEVPVDRIVERIVEVPVDRIVEKIVERIVEVPVDRIVEKIVIQPVENQSQQPQHVMSSTTPIVDETVPVSGNSTLVSPTATAQSLTEKLPLLKETQASFYLEHRQVGHYYTIDQYREFAKCAYETARTSMDALASVNLYVKTKIKNKFVYTPQS